MAKNSAESRIPVSVVRPSFLPKPKTPTGLTTKHTGSTNRRSTILSSGCITDPAGEINSRTPLNRGRQQTLTLCSSTPIENNVIKKSHVLPANWSNNNSQYDCTNKSHNDDKLLSTFQDTLTMLDDIGDSCLLDKSLGSLLNDPGNISSTTSSHCTGPQQHFLSLNKQNSFEHDESLGILTPDQMTDFTVALGGSRTPSYENLMASRLVTGSTITTITKTTTTTTSSSSSSRISRPTNIQFIADNTDLLCERSPSLEELPLDPKPLDTKLINEILLPNNQQHQGIGTSLTSSINTNNILPVTSVLNSSTSLLPMSFVTSVTSITSLEAGYQGDGENSRPASRGPDPPSASVVTAACRLQDPMTDSDFFTESDADAHEDIVRGDRRAQIIDGTLFCPPTGRQYPSFVGEEMDSSGIYSDIDKKQDELFNLEEVINVNNSIDADAIINHNDDNNDINNCRDDLVSKVIQVVDVINNYRQETKQGVLVENKDFIQIPIKSIDINNSSNSSIDSIIDISDNNKIIIDNNNKRNINELPNKTDNISTFKKYKMPKKYVASKIKAMIESNNKDDGTKEQRRIVRSPRKPGRWTEVVKKIEAGKSEQRLRPQRKDVKSRLMQNLVGSTISSSSSPPSPAPPPSSSSSSSSTRTTTTISSNKKSPRNNNCDGNKDKRSPKNQQQGVNNNNQAQETAKSSMSDLSSGTQKSTVLKRSPQTNNQQRRISNGRNSTPLKPRATINDAKKSCTLDFSPITLDKSPTPIRKSTPTKRSVANNNNNIQNSLSATVSASLGKDRIRRGSNSNSPVSLRNLNDTREQSAQTETTPHVTDIQPTENSIQALCFTIQYLTRQLDECSENAQADIHDLKSKLEEEFREKLELHEKASEELRLRHNERIANLENHHRHSQREFQDKLESTESLLRKEYENSINQLNSKHAIELQNKEEQWKEINENIKKNECCLKSCDELTTIKEEYKKLVYCIKPILSMKNRINDKLKYEINELKKKKIDNNELKKKIKELEAHIEELKKESKNNIFSLDGGNDIGDVNMVCNDQSETLRAEVWSLRSVLELQNQKNSAMRSEIDILRRDVEGKDLLEQRVESLEARCEDLKAQLQSKESYERQISHQNEILLGSFHDVSKHNKRLTQKNEELQWRLRQKNEVVSVLANQLATPPQRLSRSLGPEHIEHSIIPEKNNQPTSSSMIKFMVQKGDSVSWTLEIDDTSDNNLASNDNSRTVSRHNSFRKTPRKSLDLRARSKSVSTSDGISKDNNWTPGYNSTPICNRNRPQSDPSAKNLLPTLNNVDPNNEPNSGLMPQEAGGEAMISEEASATSSEDESSASSDISRLAMDFEWSNSVE